jgi:hypothetical protein
MTEARQCCSLSKESNFCDFRDFRETKKVIVNVIVIVLKCFLREIKITFNFQLSIG